MVSDVSQNIAPILHFCINFVKVKLKANDNFIIINPTAAWIYKYNFPPEKVFYIYIYNRDERESEAEDERNKTKNKKKVK